MTTEQSLQLTHYYDTRNVVPPTAATFDELELEMHIELCEREGLLDVPEDFE